MLTDENLKALIEAIIYVAPEPVSLETITKSLEGEERDRVKAKLEELVQEFERPEHGIEIRPVAGGYRFSSKPEHHEILRQYVKSLKPPVRLSKPALETLAVIAYRQPVTVPEIEEIRGVDCGGVIHTLLQRKLIVTSGRKNVIGRPILYRTSKDFLVHFGLKDVGELPSLKEFEELARQALGSDLSEEFETGPQPEQPPLSELADESAPEAAGPDEPGPAADPAEQAESAPEAEASEPEPEPESERAAPPPGEAESLPVEAEAESVSDKQDS